VTRTGTLTPGLVRPQGGRPRSGVGVHRQAGAVTGAAADGRVTALAGDDRHLDDGVVGHGDGGGDAEQVDGQVVLVRGCDARSDGQEAAGEQGCLQAALNPSVQRCSPFRI
jgi:hypothetical protein